jgi:hypothetical protein
MIKDLLVSFTENIKTKTTNPFFGTLILVWIFDNWRLIYSFFNFAPTMNLESRKAFLSTYLDPQNFLPNLIQCIGVTVLVLIGSYILLNFSRLIVNFFEKVITPLMYKWTDRSSIVLKKDYLILSTEKERFEKKYELERETRLKLQDEYEKLEIKLRTKEQQKPINGKQPEKKSTKYSELIKDQKNLEAFNKMTDVILNKRHVSDSETTDLMLRLNLVEKGDSDFNGRYSYALTPEGQKLREYVLEKQISKK